MPQIGEQRTAQGETRQWSGSRWEPVQAPQAVSPDEPSTFLGGATRHFMEEEPAARNALLGGAAALTGSAPVVFGAPLLGRGLQKLSEFLGTGQTNAPTPGELTGDVAQGAVEALGGRAIQAGGRALGAAGEWMGAHTPNFIRGLMRMNPKGIAAEVATSKPVAGAIEEIGRVLTPEGFSDAVGSVARGLRPGAPAPITPSVEDFATAGAETAARQGHMNAAWRQAQEVPYRGPSGVSGPPPTPPAAPPTALEALYGPPGDPGRLVPPVSRFVEDTLPAGGLDTVPDLMPYPLPKGTLHSSPGPVEDVDLTEALKALSGASEAPVPSLNALQAIPEPPMDPGGFPASWAEFLEPPGSPRPPWTARVKAADRWRYPNTYGER